MIDLAIAPREIKNKEWVSIIDLPISPREIKNKERVSIIDLPISRGILLAWTNSKYRGSGLSRRAGLRATTATLRTISVS